MNLNYFKNFSKTPESYILFFILCIAAILRFWNYGDLQFMHDELSAIDRLHFDTWAEFIEKGVKPDGHPVGVQMYLKLHKFLFGINEVGVKLPFTILGLISVYQVFKIGKDWFSSTTGLLASALFAVSHHSIYYHTIIRPYSPGILFSLLLFRVWTKIFLQKEGGTKHFVLYGILLACTAYSHYFSLLFGALLSLVGLFWVKKDQLIKYIGAGVLGLVLFTPNLGFMYDLVSEGDLGWLGLAPIMQSLHYYYYIFNFSIPLILFVLLGFTVFGGISLFKWKSSILFKKRLTIFFLSFSSFVIAQLYSYYFQPVFQYAVLVFSFPFFTLFVFSFHKELPWVYKGGGVVIIFIFGITGLVYQKGHYQIAANQPFEKFYQLISKEDNSLNICAHERNMIYLYFNHEDSLNVRLNSTKDDNLGLLDVARMLNDSVYDKVITSNIGNNYNALIALDYPFVEKREKGVFLNNFVFTKEKAEPFYHTKASLLPKDFDTSKVYDGEWGMNITRLNFDSLRKNPHDIIDIFAKVEIIATDSVQDFMLTMNVKNSEDSLFSWMSAHSKDVKLDSNAFWLVNSYEIPFEKMELNDLSIGSVIWNQSKCQYKLHEFGYGVREGNPNLYSIFDKLRD